MFGCVLMTCPGQLRHKLEELATKCIFVGYENERKGTKCIACKARK